MTTVETGERPLTEVEFEPPPRTGRVAVAAGAGAIVVALVALGVFIGGAGSGGTLETAGVGEAVPAARFEHASARTEGVSYRMEGTVRLSGMPFGGGPEASGLGTGRLMIEHDARTGRVRAEMWMHDSQFPFAMTVVYADGYQYSHVVAAFFDERVREAPMWTREPIGPEDGAGFENLGAFAGHELLDLIVAEGAEVTYDGRDAVRGTTTDRYRFGATGDGSGLVSGEVWIDGDGHLRRIRFTEAESDAQADFSIVDIGEDITIDLPPMSEVSDGSNGIGMFAG